MANDLARKEYKFIKIRIKPFLPTYSVILFILNQIRICLFLYTYCFYLILHPECTSHEMDNYIHLINKQINNTTHKLEEQDVYADQRLHN